MPPKDELWVSKINTFFLHVHKQVEYKKDLENTKGHSINFCETPQFQNAAKVAKFTSDVSDACYFTTNDV